MTAAQLAHLAELAAFASEFFAASDPSAARTFGAASLRADALSAEFRREEEHARRGVGVTGAQLEAVPEGTV
jgi:hypothetical protein